MFPHKLQNQRLVPPKRRGEIAEAAFLNRAIRLGLAVAQPWGDSERYDFIVNTGSRFWRVQVKSSSQRSHGKYGYSFKSYSQGRENQRELYTEDQIDILAAYIVPEDVWFILPIEILQSRLNFSLYPDNRGIGPIPDSYREAWSVFTDDKSS